MLQYDPRKIEAASVKFFDGLCWFTILWVATLTASMATLKGAAHWSTLAPK